MHIHVSHTDGEAKFWLDPQIELALNQGLTHKQLSDSLALVKSHEEDIRNAWYIHFGN